MVSVTPCRIFLRFLRFLRLLSLRYLALASSVTAADSIRALA